MDKLYFFKPNESKSFKFTLDQYVNLEKEYIRYTIYKELTKNIENILYLYNNSRKLYENKNIVDRFILEYINYGISPHIENIDNHSDCEYECNMDELSLRLFFNKDILDCITLQNSIFFQKMLNEYNEKNIKLTQNQINKLIKCILDMQNKFIHDYNLLNTNKHKINYFNNITCFIYLDNNTNNDKYIIKYRDYHKIITYSRYAKLIKNYDRPFPYDIIRMILRYAIFDSSNQQWSIGKNLYDNISELYDINFEMFASPLNFNMNMFCSIYHDSDRIFGSLGSFYNLTIDKLLNQNINGVFYNPPYLPILMNNTTNICIKILNEMSQKNKDFTIISFLPAWLDADYIQRFITSKYTISHRVIQKGNYVLHEKDKGKIIIGTFDLLFIIMNSNKNKLSSDKIEHIKQTFNNIIIMMKDETTTK